MRCHFEQNVYHPPGLAETRGRGLEVCFIGYLAGTCQQRGYVFAYLEVEKKKSELGRGRTYEKITYNFVSNTLSER